MELLFMICAAAGVYLPFMCLYHLLKWLDKKYGYGGKGL